MNEGQKPYIAERHDINTLYIHSLNETPFHHALDTVMLERGELWVRKKAWSGGSSTREEG